MSERLCEAGILLKIFENVTLTGELLSGQLERHSDVHSLTDQA